MGLCLLQNELCPLFFNRHVIKHLLIRKVRFHDLAFFDPVIYESLRQLVMDAENKVRSNKRTWLTCWGHSPYCWKFDRPLKLVLLMATLQLQF